MGRGKRSYPLHVYLDIITGTVTNPGRGNLKMSRDPDYVSVGYFYTYFSVNATLIGNEYVVTRYKQEIMRHVLTPEEIERREKYISNRVTYKLLNG